MSTITLKRAFEKLDEGSLDPREVVSHTFRELGIEHRYENGGKHLHAVYHVNGRQHRFPLSFGHKWDGPIRNVIKSAVRRHVRNAQATS